MKKIVLLFAFFSMVLCCYAQERLNIVENNEVKPLYSGLSLPLFGFDNSTGTQKNLFGHSFGNTALVNGSTLWKSPNFRITKYAEYTPKPFTETKIGPWICIIVGVAAMIAGPIMSATSDSSSHDAHIPGIIVFSVGAGVTAGGIIWLFNVND
jgi:hypothetical protein